VETGTGAADGLHIGVLGNSCYFTSNDNNMRMYLINGAAQMSLRNEGWIDMFGASGGSSTKLNLFAGTISGMLIKKTSATGYGLRVQTNSNADVNAFEVYNSPNVLTVIKADGRVGIGTAVPDAAYLLDVAGKVRACEVRVNNPGWCDFVFSDDYDLMPLLVLAQYINQHRHLPEMPSQAEVEERGGFDLASMSTSLLKRAEENTLYIIDLEMKLRNTEMQLLLQEKLAIDAQADANDAKALATQASSQCEDLKKRFTVLEEQIQRLTIKQ